MNDRVVNDDKITKWAAFVLSVIVMIGGALAYYVSAEQTKMKLEFQKDLNKLIIGITESTTANKHMAVSLKEIQSELVDLHVKVAKLER